MNHSLPPRRIPDYWIVACLLLAFLIIAYYAERYGQTISSPASVSTLNARPKGTKAIFKLFNEVPYDLKHNADRLTTRWSALDATDGLLVLIEPFDRERTPDARELDQLYRWTAAGGTILYCVAPPSRPMDKKDPVAGDLTVLDATAGEAKISPVASPSPLLAKVGSITINSPVRIKPAEGAPYTILFSDSQGVIAARKSIGKGQIIVLADTYLVSNAGIAQSDNVVLLANIARSAITDAGQTIVFDEYHHGFGQTSPLDEENWLTTLPLSIKRAAGMSVVLLLLLIYNGVRRFGPARSLPGNASPASTDYVTSMARWHRRVDASDIALKTLFQDIKRQIARRLDLAPDLLLQPVNVWIGAVERSFPDDAVSFVQTLRRCEELTASNSSVPVHIAPAEFMALAGQLEQIKRRLNVVGLQ